MSTWVDEIPTTHSVRLPPDPRVMDAIGGNHALATAIADLIDNAVDAKASQVLIRFIRDGGRLVALYVLDDGAGMSPQELTHAMMVGGQRAYEPGDLGHFGWGLKAASLSQADSVTVISKTKAGAAAGMRWLAEKARAAFECDVVDKGFAAREWGRPWPLALPHGTIVRWDRVRGFPSSSDSLITERWLQQTLSDLAHHLGLVFHRFLQRGVISIALDVEDADLDSSGPPNPVHPLDPMGYSRSGAAGYPRDLSGSLAGKPIHLVAHIWPGRSELPQFRLQGDSPGAFQGFYFYRNDRLLQAGGWNGLQVRDRSLQLARVQVDVTDDLLYTKAFRMNPEKTRVETGPDFAQAVEEARSEDGTSFRSFLTDATLVHKEAARRRTGRKKAIPPGKGFASRLRQRIAAELEFFPDEDPIDIRWVELPWGMFLDIDKTERVIQLNQRYRQAIVPGRGGLNDAAVVKALLYLLAQGMFHGVYWGSKDKDDLELWQALLTAAADADLNG